MRKQSRTRAHPLPPPAPQVWSQGMRKGCPPEPPREGVSSPSPGVYKPSCQVLPHPGHTRTRLLQDPGPGQEAWWRLEGGGLSNPLLLKRANREVKIGNKNKIAAATLVVCVGNKASPGPTGQAQLQPLPGDHECPPLHHHAPNLTPRAQGPGQEAQRGMREPGPNPRGAISSCAEPPPYAWAPSSATGVQTHLRARACTRLSLPGAPPAASLPPRSLAHSPQVGRRQSKRSLLPPLTGQLRPRFPRLHNHRKPPSHPFLLGLPGLALGSLALKCA